MEMRQLRYFVAIVDSASVSSAALQLHVAQPALSQHIRHMEAELGVTLLDRSSRGVTPTDAGRRLYASATAILEQATRLPDFVRDAVDNPTGDVRFGMPGTVSELVGVPLLVAARDRYPGIRIRVMEAMSGNVLDWVRRGDVDAALIYAAADPQGLETEHVLRETLCLFGRRGGAISAPAGTPLDLAIVSAQKLILPGPAHGLRKLVDEAFGAMRGSVSPLFEVDSYNHIKRLAASGAGYAILPETAIADQVRDGLFLSWKIGTPPLRRDIDLIRLKDRPLTSATRAVCELALQVTRQLVHDGTWLADIVGPK